MRFKNGLRSIRRRRLLLMQLIVASGMAASTALAIEPFSAFDCPPLMSTEVIDCCPPIATDASSRSDAGNIVPPSTGSLSSPSSNSTSPLTGDGFLDDSSVASVDRDLSTAELDNLANNFATGAAASSLASNTGSSGGLDAPNMLGDFFGGTFLDGSSSSSIVALAGGDRRFKIAENTSPLPQDRVFFNYNHFHNALSDINEDDQSLDRYTFGFEKTFLSKMASFELRLPIADGLNSTQDISNPNRENVEFGNLAMAWKFLLLASDRSALSTGLTMTLPTGDDYVEIFGSTRTLANESVHLAPFLGYLTTHERWFFQSYVQADFDAGGMTATDSFTGESGKIRDQSLLFLDASIGRWLLRRVDRQGNLTGAALISELHYTTTLNDAESMAGFTNDFNRMDVLNASMGLHFQRGLTSLRVGGSAPLRSEEEALYDAEVLVQLNRFF